MCAVANQDRPPQNLLPKRRWTFPLDFSAPELSLSLCAHVMLAEYNFKKRKDWIMRERCSKVLVFAPRWSHEGCCLGRAVLVKGCHSLPSREGRLLLSFWEYARHLLATQRNAWKGTCSNGKCVPWLVLSTIHLSFLSSIHPSIHLFTHHSFIYPPMQPSIHLSILPSIPPSIPQTPIMYQHLARHGGNTEIHRTGGECLLPSEGTHQWDSSRPSSLWHDTSRNSLPFSEQKPHLFVYSFIYVSHSFIA